MFELKDLKPNKGARKKLKRVGRGHASGQGKQGGRGHKGQQSRTGGGLPYQGFEGGQNPLYKRSPKLKGFKPFAKVEFAVINISDLAELKDKVVDIKSLIAARLIRRNARYLKVLGTGEIKTALTVQTHRISDSAKTKIEKAGGKVELVAMYDQTKGKKEQAVTAKEK